MHSLRIRHLATLWLALLLGALIFGLAQGCSKNPAAPEYANPFDPHGSAGSDPFALRAVFQGSTVVVTWKQLKNYDIVSYRVFRSLDAVHFDNLGQVAATQAATFSYTDSLPVGARTNYYKVQAFNSDELFTYLSNVVAASIPVPPVVVVGTGVLSVSRRFQTLKVRGAGFDSVKVSREAAFPDSSTVTRALGDSSTTVVVDDWDLGHATANGAVLHVYATAFSTFESGGQPQTISSDTANVPLTVQFKPSVRQVGGGTTVADRSIALAVGNEARGVTRMRFAPTRSALADSAWLPPSATYGGYVLRDDPTTQAVFAEYGSQFDPAFTYVDSVRISPDQLTSASFTLDVPANHVVGQGFLTVFSHAVATQMRLATDPAFTAAPWMAYQDTATVTLDTTPGFHVVYVQYRNYWNESAVLTDQVTVTSADVAVDIITPTDGTIVRGGTLVGLRGRAWSRDTNRPVTSVKVNVGDGFVAVDGTEDWAYDWTVPELNADTVRLITARAYIDSTTTLPADSATVEISVTVSRLAIRITAPQNGAVVTAENAVAVSGTAAPYAAGAALDSVVVLAGSARIVAAGLATWSAELTAPAAADTTVWPVVARAFAGGDSTQATVSLSVVPAK